MQDAAAPFRDRSAAFTLRDAAAVLGISLNTLRKRIAAGQIRAERAERAQGHVWRVYLDGADRSINPPGDTVQQDGAGTVQDPPTNLLRAEAMAAYTRSLLEPLTAALERSQGEVAGLREQRGRLSAELERAASTVVALGDEHARASRRATVLGVALAVFVAVVLIAGTAIAAGWAR